MFLKKLCILEKTSCPSKTSCSSKKTSRPLKTSCSSKTSCPSKTSRSRKNFMPFENLTPRKKNLFVASIFFRSPHLFRPFCPKLHFLCAYRARCVRLIFLEKQPNPHHSTSYFPIYYALKATLTPHPSDSYTVYLQCEIYKKNSFPATYYKVNSPRSDRLNSFRV